MKNSKSFSVLFWTNKAKSDVNGLVPLYARVTVEGKRAEISLKKKLSPRKWDAASGFMKGSSNEVRVINKHINDVGNALYDIYTALSQCDSGFTAEDIKNKFLGHTSVRTRRKTILEVFDGHNADVEKLVGKDYVKATLTKYKTIRDKVEAFIQSKYHREEMFLDELDFVFITAFEKYLKIEDGIEHNTAMGYIKRVKRILTIAVHNKWVTHNPFLAFKCTTRKITRTHLTDEELAVLASKKFTIKRLEEVRDCFLFSCYTGYAFVDASKLTQENIVIKNGDEYWINANRTKTAITANVPLLPEAKAIIEKYRGHVLCEIKNKLLPLKSNQKMNAYLKEIADLCCIRKNLTTHIARHTFATTVTLGNDVPIETVSKMLGHTKITTTQIYARVQEKKISRDMAALLKNNKT
ncbi:site-specific integrase [Mucilaginibacter terrae]|uniref:Integrase n=1 Tax=Mucilaginibacter terrae TaxID=1955052 RepID=A0ABU3GVD3_9SPHI|nr:site-specific integrase [Mucilaginibacter terrae]MDT3403729.1 integrase [Mucilaginibacter terrae]